jgi:murein L,D-transpeptidase YcbB/YkuD
MLIHPKKPFRLLLVLSILTLTFITQSCKKRRSDMGDILFKKTQNKVFKNANYEDLAEVFQKVLTEQKTKLNYGQFLETYYTKNGYDPVFVIDHIFNKDSLAAVEYYKKAYEHGLDPEMFKADEIAKLTDKLYSKNGIKTIEEAYRTIAELELLSANSLIRYSNFIQYGAINPKYIYARYYTDTQRPDSNAINKVFRVADIKKYLDSIQPKDSSYLVLQKALADGTAAEGRSAEETKRIIITNLERLRWKNRPTEKKYVLVNIPDYRLDVMEDGRSALNMKVCVGQGRNMDGQKTLMNYVDTDKIDKPNPHSTPQLNSIIRSVDVNPVWNIPQSIATKEIMVQAADDPFYLDNKGINVYKNGKLIDPDDIDWAKASADDYDFKQKPGADNSLGKIKFLFNNRSSVYLHDTPAKSAFKKAMRAVSHGCVRLGNPQGLALSLFGEGDKYKLIVEDMAADNPEPTTINLRPKVPVYLTYVTCWADSTGTLQVRPDVYGLDIVLYNALTILK